ncbi:MAG TPA: hypothetical protein PLU30_24610 [Verrucomicrobiae bacterium]|nr:hypothetical protein [Verrucomicrobiae bacterium]
MGDGTLEYALDGDASGLKGAFAEAQRANETMGASVKAVMQGFMSAGLIGGAVTLVLALGAAFVSAQQAAAEVDRQVKQLKTGVDGLSATQLEQGFEKSVERVRELNQEAGFFTEVVRGWNNLMSGGRNLIGEEINANAARVNELLKESEERNRQLLAIDAKRREGKTEEAALLQNQMEKEGKIADLKRQMAVADGAAKGQIATKIAQTQDYYDGLQKNIRAQMAAEKAEAEQKAAAKALAEERKRIEEQIAETQRQAAEDASSAAESAAELNRAVEAEWENLSRGTREVHDQRLAQEEIARTLEAQARQREAGLTTEQKLKQYSDGIGAALVTNVDLAERMRTAMEGSAAAVKTMSDNWESVIKKVDASGTNWAKIGENVSGIGTSIRAIVTVQAQHTTEVRHTREAYEALDTVVGQRMLSTLNRVLSTLQAIASQARAAGPAVAVLQ